VRERYDEVMARLVITLPAVTATQVLACLDAHVARLHAAGDPRTLAQLRVDVLTALVLDADPDSDADPDGDAHGEAEGGGEGLDCPDLGDEAVSMGLREWFARTYDPTAATPETRTDTGPVPSSAIEDETTGLTVDPVTGEIHDPTPATPTPPTDAPATDAPGTDAPGTDAPAAGRRPGGPKSRKRHRRGRVRVEVIATVPLATLLGHSEDPGHLTGHGPLAADQLRAMIHDLRVNAVWRCAALDDDHHTLLGLGTGTYTPNYTPGARLRRLTNRLYQDRCAFPTCTTKATYCDWDHTTPHPTGDTCSCNGIPLCRRCHRLKTTGLITVHIVQPHDAEHHGQHPPGTLIWTTATGQHHLQPPPTLTPLTHSQLYAHATATSTNALHDPPF